MMINFLFQINDIAFGPYGPNYVGGGFQTAELKQAKARFPGKLKLAVRLGAYFFNANETGHILGKTVWKPPPALGLCYLNAGLK